MNLLTLDMETFYDRDFSLTKLTTEEYIRDDRFEVIGVGVKVDDGETQWFSGDMGATKTWLSQFDWDNAFLLAHNAMFDAAILSWHFNIKPKVLLDTLAMLRAIDGTEVGNSLAKAAERYDLGVKGTEVIAAMGKRRADFSEKDLLQYGEYCKNDVDLTYKLFNILSQSFQKPELKLIDLTLRMFTEPTLKLDLPVLEQHLVDVQQKKEALIAEANADREILMSNQKFAERLIEYGVAPPMKISPTTGKPALALAKSDEGFKALAEHWDERVQALVAARLGTKSTLEETRTQRFISIAKRGTLPVPLRYYAAHTGRWGGDDKLNLQNIPRKSPLKSAIVVPKGHVLIDADSSQIEARIVAWLSGQNDLVAAFERGDDVYKLMAAKIYSKPVDQITDQERFVGKTTILGAGYGMGWVKFQLQLKNFGVELDAIMCQHILKVYRSEFSRIPALWDQGNRVLDALIDERLKTTEFGTQPQAVYLLPGVGFDLPSGLVLRYPELNKEEVMVSPGTMRVEYVYKTRKGPVRIYGGKVVENICQALARCVIGEQMLRVAKKYKVVLTVHDAVACVVKEEERDEAIKYVNECMRWRPTWAETLPLACEIGAGNSYADCGKKMSLEKWGLA
jgi:DNA polymerase I-like protein with 3'-5' exonuclease and polymerase domains